MKGCFVVALGMFVCCTKELEYIRNCTYVCHSFWPCVGQSKRWNNVNSHVAQCTCMFCCMLSCPFPVFVSLVQKFGAEATNYSTRWVSAKSSLHASLHRCVKTVCACIQSLVPSWCCTEDNNMCAGQAWLHWMKCAILYMCSVVRSTEIQNVLAVMYWSVIHT